MWMRPDIRLVATKHKSDKFLKKLIDDMPPGPVYAMYITRKHAYGELARRIDAKGNTVHVVTVDGEPIMKIVKLEKLEGR